jgi:hypothetical protein
MLSVLFCPPALFFSSKSSKLIEVVGREGEEMGGESDGQDSRTDNQLDKQKDSQTYNYNHCSSKRPMNAFYGVVERKCGVGVGGEWEWLRLVCGVWRGNLNVSFSVQN